jgi:AraC-like DNA-binding protein
MARSCVVEFSDPQSYQAAIRPAEAEILVTANGVFHAELKRIELARFWVQSGSENLPRIANSATRKDRPPIFFLTRDQVSISHSGRNLEFGEIVVGGSGATHHHRTTGPCHWATLSLTQSDFAAAFSAVVGQNLSNRSVTRYLRPPRLEMARLLGLHQAVEQLAEAPAEILAQPEPVRTLEQALLHALVTCVSVSAPAQMSWGTIRHTVIIARFEELLAANYDRPLHLPEICAAIGASERTLRVSCMEHLGMGPVRYLWLRRMHLAHRALILTMPGTSTVTEIATANGFWELGRFAVEYRKLFGEAPSVSLRRPAREMRKPRTNPFVFADSEYDEE